jgi:hypothetical protein
LTESINHSLEVHEIPATQDSANAAHPGAPLEVPAADFSSVAQATPVPLDEPIAGLASVDSVRPGDLLPDEIPFSLTRMEYRVLCSGETNESRASRNFFLGLLVSAVLGLAALLAEVDWAQAFRQARPWAFVWAALLFAVVICSACCAAIQHRHSIRDNRPYYALMTRLREYFEEEQGQV